MIELVMFDLDGTLVDSAPDIAAIVNQILAEQSLPELSLSCIRSAIGHGARHTVAASYAQSAACAGQAHPLSPSSLLLDRLMGRYAELHSAQCGMLSHVYPGVAAALERLHQLSVRLAVVTNKEERFARELLASVELMRWFPVVIGGDTLPTRKPDPAPLRHCLAIHRLPPERALMLGDSAIDMMAARAAGVRVMLVRHGYSPAMDAVQAELTIESLADLVSHLEANEGSHRRAASEGTSR